MVVALSDSVNFYTTNHLTNKALHTLTYNILVISGVFMFRPIMKDKTRRETGLTWPSLPILHKFTFDVGILVFCQPNNANPSFDYHPTKKNISPRLNGI